MRIGEHVLVLLATAMEREADFASAPARYRIRLNVKLHRGRRRFF